MPSRPCAFSFLALLCPTVAGQYGPPAPVPRFVKDLEKITFAQPVAKGPLTVCLRKVSLFGPAMREAVRETDAGARAPTALDDLIRVSFTEPGWFLRTEVEAATYKIGYARHGADIDFVLFDEEGRGLGRDRLRVRTARLNQDVAIQATNGAYLVVLWSGSERHDFRFVPRREFEVRTRDLRPFESGQVTIHTDLRERDAAVERLAKECDRAVAVHARWLGKEKVPGRLRLYLLDDERFRGLAKLLSDDRLIERAGIYDWYTQRALINHVSLSIEKHPLRPPFSVRATAIHELHHIIADRLYAQANARWPLWLNEGLAVAATTEALGDAGRGYHRTWLARWRRAGVAGKQPSFDQVLTDDLSVGVNELYGGAYLLTLELAKRPEALTTLLSSLADRVRDTGRCDLARILLYEHWNDPAALWAKMPGR